MTEQAKPPTAEELAQWARLIGKTTPGLGEVARLQEVERRLREALNATAPWVHTRSGWVEVREEALRRVVDALADKEKAG